MLWELSAGSDSAARRDGKIELFVTLGSPLGESGVRSQLADAGEEAVKYPRNIRRWANFAAEDDVISHDRTLADNFHRMCEQGWVDEISDREVYNLYVHREEDGNLRVDPHRLYGYLDDHQVAGVIADWILRSDEGPAPS